MAKSNAEVPADMWLHVATDALARYAAGGGETVVMEAVDTDDSTPSLMVVLKGVTLQDPRIAPDFVNGLMSIEISQWQLEADQ